MARKHTKTCQMRRDQPVGAGSSPRFHRRHAGWQVRKNEARPRSNVLWSRVAKPDIVALRVRLGLRHELLAIPLCYAFRDMQCRMRIRRGNQASDDGILQGTQFFACRVREQSNQPLAARWYCSGNWLARPLECHHELGSGIGIPAVAGGLTPHHGMGIAARPAPTQKPFGSLEASTLEPGAQFRFQQGVDFGGLHAR